ncbi:MAG TPA: hypothetical protein DCY91_16135, partial [Cyanobacteria bacterium UBA11370]|nr:hypothetical protein [Cyanobacteria bacterium UBA11370]
EIKGLNSENPGLLRRAKGFYSDLGNNAKAYFCEAWALKFEGQFKDAGNYFIELGNGDEARDCFWQGMCWSELVNWYNLNKNYRTEERSIALFMIADSQDLEAINRFTTFIVSQGFTLATDVAT